MPDVFTVFLNEEEDDDDDDDEERILCYHLPWPDTLKLNPRWATVYRHNVAVTGSIKRSKGAIIFTPKIITSR